MDDGLRRHSWLFGWRRRGPCLSVYYYYNLVLLEELDFGTSPRFVTWELKSTKLVDNIAN
jgi:hypothetical protein